MKIKADDTQLEDIIRLKITIAGRDYIISEKDGKMHVIKDANDRLQVEPLTTNSIDLI